MGNPTTLPADFFERHPADVAPKTLPANFFDSKDEPPPEAAKQAQATEAPKGSVLNQFLDSPQGKEMQKSNVDAGKFGTEAIAGRMLFSPSTITKAGPLVPGGRDAAGRMLPWIESQVSGKGPSLARRGVSGVVAGAKGAAAWMKANPVKALVLEGIARQMGIDPIQLVSKVIKLGGDGK